MTYSEPPGDAPDLRASWARVVCVALGLSLVHVQLFERWLAGALDARGCDGSLLMARRWARRHGLDGGHLVEGLLALGAACDCAALEVVAR